MNAYADYCRAALHAIGRDDVPWDGTRGHLPRAQFTREAKVAGACWDQDPQMMLALAASHGFAVDQETR